jgi:hypothetical protein
LGRFWQTWEEIDEDDSEFQYKYNGSAISEFSMHPENEKVSMWHPLPSNIPLCVRIASHLQNLAYPYLLETPNANSRLVIGREEWRSKRGWWYASFVWGVIAKLMIALGILEKDHGKQFGIVMEVLERERRA